MKIMAASARIWLLLLLAAPGYSTYDFGTHRFDDPRTQTLLRVKHFCPTCITDADAGVYSRNRNIYCHTNLCKKSGKNTVFVADFDAEQASVEYFVLLFYYYNYFLKIILSYRAPGRKTQ